MRTASAFPGATARLAGAEVVAGGNDEAEAVATGLVLGWQPQGSKWSFSIRAGYRFQDDADGPYADIEFGRSL